MTTSRFRFVACVHHLEETTDCDYSNSNHNGKKNKSNSSNNNTGKKNGKSNSNNKPKPRRLD
eukprot:880882-Amphidinium_carterae.1